MTTLSLTNPVPGTTADANMIASNNNAILAVVNGNIDGTNIAAGATPSFTSLTLSQNLKTALSLSGAAAGLTIAGDTNLYRPSAGVLKTDGQFYGVGDIRAQQGQTNQVALGAVGPSGQAGVLFNSAADTNLYRLGASELKTDGKLRAGSRIIANDGLATQIDLDNDGHIYFSNLTDTNLYRASAGVLKTDSVFVAAGNLYVGLGITGESGSGVQFFSNAAVVPSTTPTGGGVLYVQAGALKYRGSSGTITTIAVA